MLLCPVLFLLYRSLHRVLLFDCNPFDLGGLVSNCVLDGKVLLHRALSDPFNVPALLPLQRSVLPALHNHHHHLAHRAPVRDRLPFPLRL